MQVDVYVGVVCYDVFWSGSSKFWQLELTFNL